MIEAGGRDAGSLTHGPASEPPDGTTPEDASPEDASPEDVVAADHPHVRAWVLFTILGVGLAVAAVVATAIGAFDTTPSEVVRVITHRIGLPVGARPEPLVDSVVWDIRIPRVLLAIVVGGALGCAGAAMQGSFANPLAEPGIIGVSSGAALGAVAAIVGGFVLLDTWSVAAAAFVGGLITVAVVYFASRSDGRTEVVTLILTGVALNALAGAVIGLITYLSNDAELRSITFWTLGSVAQATWPKVLVVLPIAIAGVVVASTQARRLDLLALGERSARHLGVDVERLRVLMLFVIALLTAAAVAVSGIILFVGLVMPHIVRMIAGPGHRVLLPASALAGALALVVADTISRTAIEPSEIPLGVLTALVGAPFFLWMLRRTRARQGGWA
ncbi:MAG: ABC transporter permease [Acidimicrobiia bacterium]